MRSTISRIGIAVVLCLIGHPGIGRAQSNDIYDIARKVVDKFQPPELIDPDNPDYRANCFGIYDLAKDGSPPSIIAVYPEYANDDVDGKVLALKRVDGGQYAATDITPSHFSFAAHACDIELIDVDRTGRNVLELDLLQGPRVDEHAEYLFRWDGSTLKSIGPTTQHGSEWEAGLYHGFGLWNLYDDGTIAVSSLQEDADPDDPELSTIYVLKNGVYAPISHAVFVDTFFKGLPEDLGIDEFDVDARSVGPYTLQIGNGEVDGSSRANDPIIYLNGKVVLPSGRLNRKTGKIRVQLNNVRIGQNTMKVVLTGDKSAKITVAIECQAVLPKVESSP